MKVTCHCGTTFEARSAKARFCSDRCRKRAAKPVAEVVDLPAATSEEHVPGPVETATIRTLSEAGRADTPLGAAALVLARRLDSPGFDTGAAIAATARQLEATLFSAMRGADTSAAPAVLRDELASRRAAHGA